MDPVFKTIGLWKKGGDNNAQAVELRRFNASATCEGDYMVLSVDVLKQCTSLHIPGPASLFVAQKNSTMYVSS
jgi:hypothetical protein